MSGQYLSVPVGLQTYISADVVSIADVEGARIVLSLASHTRERSLLMWLALSLAIRSARDGHSCIDLANIGQWGPHAGMGIEWSLDVQEWKTELAAHADIVGTPESVATVPRCPLVLDENRLYLARVYAEECAVAQRLLTNPDQQLRIILGGPGTGKTTLVAQRLVDLPDEAIPSIALCAPTGKASRHLKRVLERRLIDQGASDALKAALELAPSLTAHKLLGYSPSASPRYRFNAENLLPFRLVIVDETSMMSLSAMARLTAALHPDAELWLVGDPHQLASVEAGTVLADIALGAESASQPLHAVRTLLTEQHRFKSDSAIAMFAAAVRDGDVTTALSLLQKGGDGFTWIDPLANREALARLGASVAAHAQNMVSAALEGDVAKALSLKAQMQVLSATRGGQLGVREWNTAIEAQLGQSAAHAWYAGRPILVTRNDAALNLANGDVGVVCIVNGERRAFFGSPEDPIDISIARLPYVETVHALTIHKSQGSEYESVVVVLPTVASRITTRELLYTGVSRPTQSLTIVATEAAIRAAVATSVRRATGLAARL